MILNNYLVTYSFIGVFFELRYQNVTWNLIQNWRIESRDILSKLTRSYLKSISSHIKYLLGWLYGLFLNNYPVTYSFNWLLFVFTAEKYYLEFESKLKDWIKRYLIETWHRLFQRCFKSYRVAFRMALWLDFGQLSSYLFVYRRLFSSYDIKMLHVILYKLEDWIKWYLIETWHRSFQVYLKSYRIAFLRWLYGLILNNYPVTYSFHGVFFELRYQNVTWNLIQNWRIESTDILFKLTTGYLKSISSLEE